jgi:hypothetical protein
MTTYRAALAITTAVLSGALAVSSAQACPSCGMSSAGSSAASSAGSSASSSASSSAARAASNAASSAASSAMEGARGGKKSITPQEAWERQTKWVEKTFEGISSGKIKVKNRDKYTDEQLIEKLNTLAHNKINAKYDVHEPDIPVEINKVKVFGTREELEAYKAKLDQKQKEDFEKERAEYWKKANAEAAEKKRKWDEFEKRNEARRKEAEEKERLAEIERQKDPNYIDKKGFNKTDNPNPYVEANQNKTSRGQALKDAGAGDVGQSKSSRGQAYKDATR